MTLVKIEHAENADQFSVLLKGAEKETKTSLTEEKAREHEIEFKEAK